MENGEENFLTPREREALKRNPESSFDIKYAPSCDDYSYNFDDLKKYRGKGFWVKFIVFSLFLYSFFILYSGVNALTSEYKVNGGHLPEYGFESILAILSFIGSGSLSALSAIKLIDGHSAKDVNSCIKILVVKLFVFDAYISFATGSYIAVRSAAITALIVTYLLTSKRVKYNFPADEV